MHPELLTETGRLSAEQKIPLAHHLAESREELELLRHGSGPFVQLLKEFDAWDPDAIPVGSRPLDYLRMLAEAHRALVIHGNYLDDEEIDFLAAHADRMSVVYCPRTHAFFQHDRYPLAKMLAAGVNVAIGTDSRASTPDLNPLAEMRLAAEQHHEVSAEICLRMITAAAAKALGREEEIGTLTPGKFADLAIVQLPDHQAADPHELLFDPQCRAAATIFRGEPCTTSKESIHSRQFVICVSRMAVAPSASNRSMISITSPRVTITAHGAPVRIFQRADGGGIEARRDLFRLRQFGARHVVFQQRIAAGDHHALQAADDAVGQFRMPPRFDFE